MFRCSVDASLLLILFTNSCVNGSLYLWRIIYKNKIKNIIGSYPAIIRVPLITISLIFRKVICSAKVPIDSPARLFFTDKSEKFRFVVEVWSEVKVVKGVVVEFFGLVIEG